MKRNFYSGLVAVVFFLIIMVSAGLAFDWRRVLSIAESGDDSLTPINVVLIFDFSSIPCESSRGYSFLSPVVRIAYSQMYEILDELGESTSLKVIFSFSSRFMDDIRKYSVGGVDNYLKKSVGAVDLARYIPEDSVKPRDLLEWNYIWLPHSLKKSFSIGSSMSAYVSMYKMIASSLMGRLIAFHSEGRISIAALPYSESPVSVAMNSYGRDWVDADIETSLRALKSVFGDISIFYPPALDLSGEVLDVLKDNRIIWTFSSYFSTSEPVISDGIRIIGMDISLSEGIKEIRNDEDFSRWISQMHRLQKRGRKAFAIVIDAYWWFFKSYDFKHTFFEVLSRDRYIKTVFPEEVEYRASERFIGSSEVGDISSWIRSDNRLYLWKRFNVLLSYYRTHEKFLKDSEKREIILNSLLVLNERSLYLVDSQSEIRDDVLCCVDLISRRIMTMLGEDPGILVPLKEEVEKSFYINVLQEEVQNVNGVEDEGYWEFAKKIEGGKFIKYVKVVGLNNCLALSIKLNEKAKDYIGKSYCLRIELDSTVYKIFFKLWDGRVLVYQKSDSGIFVLNKMEGMQVSIWDVVEFYIRDVEYPVKFRVVLDDSRKNAIIESVPEYRVTIVESLRR